MKEIREELQPQSEYEEGIIVFDDILGSTICEFVQEDDDIIYIHIFLYIF